MRSNVTPAAVATAEPLVSFYTALKATTKAVDLPLSTILQSIRAGSIDGKDFTGHILTIRQARSKQEANALKEAHLPCFTTSGTFAGAKRNNAIQQHSGLLQVDFDDVPDVAAQRRELESDPHTLAAYLSPTGKGLKLIIRIPPDAQQHAQSFALAEAYYLERYGLQMDKACKNVARANFLSFDLQLYHNPAALKLSPAALETSTKTEQKITAKASLNSQKYPEKSPQKTIENQAHSGLQHKNTTERTSNDVQPGVSAHNGATISQEQSDELETLVGKLETSGTDITEPYGEWVRVGFALAGAMGEAGRALFHRISAINPKYDAAATDRKFSDCLAKGNGSVKLATIFALAQARGIYAREPALSFLSPTAGADTPPAAPSVSTTPTLERPQTKFAQVEDYLSARYHFRYNEVSNEVESRPVDGDAFQPCNSNNIYRRLQREGISFSKANVEVLLASDFVTPFNPFQHYFEHLEAYKPDWERDYIAELCSYIHAKDQERFNRHFRKMLVRAIACALEPAVFNKHAFVLVHPKQNSGKSTFCRWLCPPALSSFIAENIGADKDGLIALSNNLLINLDELATLGKHELNALKALFSKDAINVRRPFERKQTTTLRRASFVGSTNDPEFLTDLTGSVRWLCFEIDNIAWKYSEVVDVDRLWAQAYHHYRSGFKFQLTKDELEENERANAEHLQATNELELVQQHCKPGTTFYTTTDVQGKLQAVSGLRLGLKAVGQALRYCGFSPAKKGNTAHARRRGYLLGEF